MRSRKRRGVRSREGGGLTVVGCGRSSYLGSIRISGRRGGSRRRCLAAAPLFSLFKRNRDRERSSFSSLEEIEIAEVSSVLLQPLSKKKKKKKKIHLRPHILIETEISVFFLGGGVSYVTS